MKKAILLCFSIFFTVSKISAQAYKVDGPLYDTIYAVIEHEGVSLRLVTTIYKDTLMRNESLMVPAYPIIRNQKIEVYQNGSLKHWHYIKIPKKYAYTTSGKWVRYQTIPVLGMSVQKNGEKHFFMSDGAEYGCGVVGEFLGIYSTQGETMYETYGTGNDSIIIHGDKNWRKKYGYSEPDTEIDYAFSSRCRLKDVTIANFIQP